MAAIVSKEYRTRHRVLKKVRIRVTGLNPSAMPEIIPEISKPVPVADNQFHVKIASSARASGTTGGMRNTALSSSGTAIFGMEIPFSKFLTCGSPQTNTKTDSTIHGSHAIQISPEVNGLRSLDAFSLSAASSSGNLHFVFGCQKRNKTIIEMIDAIAATMSTSVGP